jgi:ABC-2 type transport system ATP-binding protein
VNTILSINGLSKKYGPIRAVNNLSLDVPEGSIYGLLGPNGSGKTTTLGMVLGVINPSEGSYRWLGQSVESQARKEIGAFLEQPNFYPYLTGYQNLKVVARIKQKGANRIDDVLRQVNLYERRHSKFKTYSLGMKQRLSLAAALLADPKALVLDEPTNGLDPQGIAEVRELILEIGRSGKTILIASHILAEVERVCTHVAVLKKGNLLAEGRVDEILPDQNTWEISSGNLESLAMIFSLNPQVKEIKREEGVLIITAPGATGEAINEYAHSNGIFLSHLKYRKQSLEAHFLALTSETGDGKAS